MANDGPVDEPHPGVDGVHAQALPGQVEERGRDDDVDRHPRIGAQQHHRALGHERRAGNGVGDVPRSPPTDLRRGHDLLDDGGVDVVEGVRIARRDGRGPRRARWRRRRPPPPTGWRAVRTRQRAAPRSASRVAGGHELGTGGAEPHHRHPRAAGLARGADGPTAARQPADWPTEPRMDEPDDDWSTEGLSTKAGLGGGRGGHAVAGAPRPVAGIELDPGAAHRRVRARR